MPIYLYQCDDCGVRFEQKQLFSEAPLEVCPECEGHIRRIIQPVGVIFKGSGFYITDNRQVSSPTLKPAKDKDKDKNKTESSSSEPATAAKDSTSSTTTETKTE